MEVEIYQMIYIRKIKETIFNIISHNLKLFKPKLYDEIKSNNIRILGHDFVKNNKNKNILIINNKKNKLKEFINDREFKGDEIKIKMILIKELYHIAHMFENCLHLKEIHLYNNIQIHLIKNLKNLKNPMIIVLIFIRIIMIIIFMTTVKMMTQNRILQF